MTREICHGITYADIVTVAVQRITFDAAAKKLGVAPGTLRKHLRLNGMLHWFQRQQLPRGYATSITEADIASVAGLTMGDAAAVLGYSSRHLGQLVKRHGWQGYFPNRGQARWIATRGYVGRDSE
jgi:hypothetical protein